MSEQRVGIHGIVQGRVQGVGFRWFTKKRAQSLGLQGWVRNLSGGDVEVFFWGSPADVEQMKTHLEKGPIGARVDNLRYQSGSDFEMVEGFSIRDTHGRGSCLK